MKREWIVPILVSAFFVFMSLYARKVQAFQSYEEAQRILCGGNIETQQVSVSTFGSTASTLLTARVKRPWSCVKNLNASFKVGIGSNTVTLEDTGYILNVAPNPTAEVCFQSYTGELYAFGDGDAATKPTVSVIECLYP